MPAHRHQCGSSKKKVNSLTQQKLPLLISHLTQNKSQFLLALLLLQQRLLPPSCSLSHSAKAAPGGLQHLPASLPPGMWVVLCRAAFTRPATCPPQIPAWLAP